MVTKKKAKMKTKAKKRSKTKKHVTRAWTAPEIKYLQASYRKKPASQVAKEMKRSLASVRGKISVLGLTKPIPPAEAASKPGQWPTDGDGRKPKHRPRRKPRVRPKKKAKAKPKKKKQ